MTNTHQPGSNVSSAATSGARFTSSTSTIAAAQESKTGATIRTSDQMAGSLQRLLLETDRVIRFLTCEPTARVPSELREALEKALGDVWQELPSIEAWKPSK